MEPEILIEAVNTVPGVRKVNRVRSRWVGSACVVDMRVSVEPTISTSDSHAIADTIEDLLEKNFDIEDTTIHIEPDA